MTNDYTPIDDASTPVVRTKYYVPRSLLDALRNAGITLPDNVELLESVEGAHADFAAIELRAWNALLNSEQRDALQRALYGERYGSPTGRTSSKAPAIGTLRTTKFTAMDEVTQRRPQEQYDTFARALSRLLEFDELRAAACAEPKPKQPAYVTVRRPGESSKQYARRMRAAGLKA